MTRDESLHVEMRLCGGGGGAFDVGGVRATDASRSAGCPR